MPLARHDSGKFFGVLIISVSTHMPLARHDRFPRSAPLLSMVSTHMPLARHDNIYTGTLRACLFLLTCLLRGMTNNPVACDENEKSFYSHASCEA